MPIMAQKIALLAARAKPSINSGGSLSDFVMAGLVPAIHAFYAIRV
ncbi:MAG: hypothetical protein P8Y53_02620 [Pseudolabrys sp.]